MADNNKTKIWYEKAIRHKTALCQCCDKRLNITFKKYLQGYLKCTQCGNWLDIPSIFNNLDFLTDECDLKIKWIDSRLLTK